MATGIETSAVTTTLPPRPIPTAAALLRTLVVLFKLRIVALLLFAGAGGAFLAAGGWPGIGPLALLTLSGGCAAAGASALNQYLEQTEDRTMRRTRRRPLVTGAIGRSGWVPVAALALILLPALAVLPLNPMLSFWSLAGAFVYVGVYTVWLKPRTVLNIVIGGAAGTCAVLSGGAAAGNWADPGVIVLGLLVFLWTPTHFWSLAILYREDYARVGVPMLPVRASARQSALWVTFHAVATGMAALILGAHVALGWLYLFPATLATIDLLWRSGRLVARPTPDRARSLFMASNTYLAIILLMVCLDALI
ncbi:MAG: heme o synthase [Ardenticatenaceae bacterium]|nr:heme o synthase [Ardenticatenaceae bacterium]